MIAASLYIIFLILLLGAAASDIRTRLIPNRYPAVIVLLFLPAAGLGVVGDWPGHLLVFAASFAACLPLFAYGLFGGGDAKLLPAGALWAGPEMIAAFLLATAVAGGALALAMLARRRMRAATASAREIEDEAPPTVPYGAAIAAGGLIVASQSLLNAFPANRILLLGSGV